MMAARHCLALLLATASVAHHLDTAIRSSGIQYLALASLYQVGCAFHLYGRSFEDQVPLIETPRYDKIRLFPPTTVPSLPGPEGASHYFKEVVVTSCSKDIQDLE